MSLKKTCLPKTGSSPQRRLFLSLSARLDAYREIQHDFTPLLKGRWVNSTELHATLFFFGDRFKHNELLERLDLLDFSLETSIITGLDCFKRSHILFARTVNPSLEHFHYTLCSVLKLPETPFTPHITLMRIKTILDQKAFQLQLQHYHDRPLGNLSNTLTLISSRLTHDGPCYSIIKEWKP